MRVGRPHRPYFTGDLHAKPPPGLAKQWQTRRLSWVGGRSLPLSTVRSGSSRCRKGATNRCDPAGHKRERPAGRGPRSCLQRPVTPPGYGYGYGSGVGSSQRILLVSASTTATPCGPWTPDSRTSRIASPTALGFA
jgi:hypothetical protein